VKGIDMWGINTGILSEGYILGVSWQKYLDRHLSVKAGGIYEFYYIPNFKYNLYALHADGQFTFLSNNKNLYFNLTAGVISGVDNLYSESISLDKRKFVIGEKVGLNAEFYIKHNMKIDFGVFQRFFQKKQNESMGIVWEASLFFKL
jgi:hypothetical protein